MCPHLVPLLPANARSGLRPRYCSVFTGLIAAEGEPMRGVHEALRYFRHTGYNIALATSSSRQVIAAVLNKLSLWHYFDVICSGR